MASILVCEFCGEHWTVNDDGECNGCCEEEINQWEETNDTVYERNS